MEFHPDGLLLGAGLKNGVIKIYDMRSLKPMIEIDKFKGLGEVSSLAFSNKGLYFAAAWKNSSSCRVFNLRKMQEESLEVSDPEGFKTSFVSFDYYGNYLATCAGTAVSLYTGK